MQDFVTILGVELRLGCFACPEAYDAYINNEYVGYFRLRHGMFTVWDCTDSEIIYQTTEVEGDGIFEHTEREKFLTIGVIELLKYLGKDYNNV